MGEEEEENTGIKNMCGRKLNLKKSLVSKSPSASHPSQYSKFLSSLVLHDTK